MTRLIFAIGMFAFGFITGLLVGAILSGGLDDMDQDRKDRKNR